MQTEESVTEDRVDELSLKIRVFGFPSPPGALDPRLSLVNLLYKRQAKIIRL